MESKNIEKTLKVVEKLQTCKTLGEAMTCIEELSKLLKGAQKEMKKLSEKAREQP